jgi:hypothetical protein
MTVRTFLAVESERPPASNLAKAEAVWFESIIGEGFYHGCLCSHRSSESPCSAGSG